MRERKFRVWDKTKGVMVYPSDRPCIEDYYIGLDGALFWHIDDLVNDTGKSLRVFLPEQAEIMEWTGLHDKNGKEIFEGDVVRIFKDSIVTEGYIIGLIEYEDNCAAFYFSHYQGWSSSLSGLLEDSEDIEIIGNQFENQELLESK